MRDRSQHSHGAGLITRLLNRLHIGNLRYGAAEVKQPLADLLGLGG
jgi:hypothetical protein